MGGITGRGVTGGDGAPANEDYVTYSDETANLPNSRQLIAGDNITLDTATPGELAINATGGAPGGADMEIQYNDAGAFAGSSAFTWNDADVVLTLGPGPASVSYIRTPAEGNNTIQIQGESVNDARIEVLNGDGDPSDGGDLIITAGSALNSGTGGTVEITAGNAAGGNTGGSVVLRAGLGDFGEIAFHTDNTFRMAVGAGGELRFPGAGAGTAGQVLTTNGDGASPEWASVETSGTFQITFTGGFTTQPTQDVSWSKIGSLVVLRFTSSVSATSNAVTFTTSAGDLPVNLRPTASICLGGTCGGTNNGAATEAFLLLTTSGVVSWQVNTNGVASNWTNSGTKGISVGSTRLSTFVYSTTT